MTRPFDHWKSEFFTTSRKTPIGIHVLAHSWYRARHAAEVVATRLSALFPRVPEEVWNNVCKVQRQGPAEAGRAARGDYIAVADEAGGIRVFRVLKGQPVVVWIIGSRVGGSVEEL